MNTNIDPKIAAFDYDRFSQTVDIVRESQGIDSISKLAEVIGVGEGVLHRLRKGEGVTFDAMVKIIAWSKQDVRSYILQNGSEAADTGAMLREDRL